MGKNRKQRTFDPSMKQNCNTGGTAPSYGQTQSEKSASSNSDSSRNNSSGGQNNSNRNNGNGGQNSWSQSAVPASADRDAVPEDYVDQAESVIMKIRDNYDRYNQITTSKLRNLYSLVTDIYDREQLRTEATLLDTSVAGLQRMRVRLAYECGREPATKSFVTEAKLIPYVKGVGKDRLRMLRFAHYLEALVAYHRFYHLGNEK